jgi:hypothetical protein
VPIQPTSGSVPSNELRSLAGTEHMGAWSRIHRRLRAAERQAGAPKGNSVNAITPNCLTV